MSVLGRLSSNLTRNSFQMRSSEFFPNRCFRTKRSQNGTTPPAQPQKQSKLQAEEGWGNGPPVGFSALGRPVAFCAAFSVGSFAGCAIWQYENMREAARRSRFPNWRGDMFGRKAGDLREELRQWWAALSPANKMYVPICAINCLVFAAWRYPPIQGLMLKWFSSNPAGKATCLPMLLSAFSHHSLFHLGANMFVLHSFIGPAVQLLGQEQFLGVYLSSAVLTSLASYFYKVGVGRMGNSLGASGAICTVLGIFGTLMPEARMQILFLPMINFSASSAIQGLLCMDAAGMLLGWRLFDHAAHFSGVLFGIFWVHLGSRLLWDSREPLVRSWHKMRTEYGK